MADLCRIAAPGSSTQYVARLKNARRYRKASCRREPTREQITPVYICSFVPAGLSANRRGASAAVTYLLRVPQVCICWHHKSGARDREVCAPGERASRRVDAVEAETGHTGQVKHREQSNKRRHATISLLCCCPGISSDRLRLLCSYRWCPLPSPLAAMALQPQRAELRCRREGPLPRCCPPRPRSARWW